MYINNITTFNYNNNKQCKINSLYIFNFWEKIKNTQYLTNLLY